GILGAEVSVLQPERRRQFQQRLVRSRQRRLDHAAVVARPRQLGKPSAGPSVRGPERLPQMYKKYTTRDTNNRIESIAISVGEIRSSYSGALSFIVVVDPTPSMVTALVRAWYPSDLRITGTIFLMDERKVEEFHRLVQRFDEL